MFKRPSVYLSVIGLAAAILLVIKLRHVEPPATPLVEPAHAPFANSIGARGIIESIDENIRIAPPTSGLVIAVHVKVGDHINADQTLVQLDDRDAKAVVRTQEAQFKTLQAKMKEAEVALADKQDQLHRVTKLSVNNVSSVDEKQRADFATQIAATQVLRASAELELAQTQLARARVQLDLLTIKAPRSGSVLQVNIQPGEYASVGSNQPVMLLGQTNSLQVRAEVDEENASRVRPGCQAVAFIKGERENAIPLKFVRIEPYIIPKKSLTGESSERVDTRVLQIIFRFEQPEIPVYVGQQLDIFLDAGGTRGI